MPLFNEEELEYIKDKSKEIGEKFDNSKWGNDMSFMGQWFKSEASDRIVGSYTRGLQRHTENIDRYERLLETGRSLLEVSELSYDADGEQKEERKLYTAEEAKARVSEIRERRDDLEHEMVTDLFACAAALKKKMDGRSFWDKFIGFFTGRNSELNEKYDYLTKGIIGEYVDSSVNIEKIIEKINKPEPVAENVVSAEKAPEVSEEQLQQEQRDLENQLKQNTGMDEIERARERENITMSREQSIDGPSK